MRKAIAFVLVMLGLTLTVSACTGKAKQTEDKKMETTQNLKGKKVLVAYFSWSGNTQDAANYIAKKTGADEFRIETVKPYPTEYDACTKIAEVEKNTDARPDIKGKVADMDKYDVVFVGAPVWYYTAPMAVFTFLEQYDFKGKTVIPFTTCYTAEYETLNDIVKKTPGAKHLDGLVIKTHEINAKEMPAKHAQIDTWLKKLGF